MMAPYRPRLMKRLKFTAPQTEATSVSLHRTVSSEWPTSGKMKIKKNLMTQKFPPRLMLLR